MKNIHVLPTDKPSRLWMDSDNNLNLHIIPTTLFKMQNIYITSDEEIKDYWFLNTLSNEIGFTKGSIGIQKNAKKIILTTDQDLIKDGVQSIDDEFLEWFVKNPSCEEVKVENVYKTASINFGNQFNYYKIIIPKEEPDYTALLQPVGTIQETLEEAKNNAWDNYEHVEGNLYSTLFKNGFEIGAKWQAERMYSKEEVIKIVEKSRKTGLTAEILLLFEQLKKK
jgi:hypothetical protein